MIHISTVMRRTAVAAVCCAMGLVVAPASQAAERTTPRGDCPAGKETPQQVRQRTHKLRQVQGTIVATKTVDVKGAAQKDRVVLLKTQKDNRRLVVDLGAANELKGMKLRRGSTIAAEGFVTRIGDKQFMVATRVKQGDEVATIDRTWQVKQTQGEHSQGQGRNEKK